MAGRLPDFGFFLGYPPVAMLSMKAVLGVRPLMPRP